jgi:hypothetical protein
LRPEQTETSTKVIIKRALDMGMGFIAGLTVNDTRENGPKIKNMVWPKSQTLRGGSSIDSMKRKSHQEHARKLILRHTRRKLTVKR